MKIPQEFTPNLTELFKIDFQTITSWLKKIYIGKETFKGVIVSPSVTDRSTHKGIIYNGSNKSFLLFGFFLLRILDVCKILSTAKGVLDINFGICLKFLYDIYGHWV